MDHHVRINLFSTAAILAAGIVVSVVTSVVVVSRSLEHRAKEQTLRTREINVKGSARTRVRSDTGVWRISVHGNGKELKDAFAILDSGVAKVRAFLESHEFAAGDLTLAAIDTTTHYARDIHNNETREVVGYSLHRTFTISTTNVNRIATAAGEVTQLIKDGVQVTSGAPEYYYTKIADMKVQMLGEASKDARSRAEEIVRNSGGSVGSVRDARMSPLQITRPDSTQVSGEGMYDTSTIEKDVTAVVTVTFGVGT